MPILGLLNKLCALKQPDGGSPVRPFSAGHARWVGLMR
jgi:hypothetical protein